MSDSPGKQPQQIPAGVKIAIAVLFIGIVIACLLPATGSRTAPKRTACKNNLKQLGLALHNYHDAYDMFPPAYVADARGRPEHSWRVFALPYIDQAVLYNRYRFDEPWNGPHNSELAENTLMVYQCPSDAEQREEPVAWTSYVAVVGPHTVWPGAEATKIRDITDGTTNTLLVAESRNTGIHWMEPRDLHIGQMAMTLNPVGGQGISSQHWGGAHALLGDGSVHFISEGVDPALLRRLMERDDGEDVGAF